MDFCPAWFPSAAIARIIEHERSKKEICEHGVRYKQGNDIQQRKNSFMKTISNSIDKISPMKQSKWILPALMAFAISAVLLGVTGCSPPHH